MKFMSIIHSLVVLVTSLGVVAFDHEQEYGSSEIDQPKPLSYVQILQGSVDAGNYTYYTLDRDGHVTLVLRSLEGGDADLYASTSVKRPSYKIAKHEYQSMTCGLDRVDIEQSAPRPLYIAIYGHPSRETTRFLLAVILTKNLGRYWDGYANLELELLDVPSEFFEETSMSDEDSEASSPDKGGGSKDRFGTFAQSLFEVLVFVLELIVEVLG